MNPFEIIGGVILLIASIIIIAVVMLQESKQANGMNAVTGSTDTYIGRNGNRTKDAFYAKLTKILAIAFFVLAIVLNLVVRFVK